MPALAKSREGSLTGTTGEDGKGVCPRFDSKYSMNVCLTCKIGRVVGCSYWLLASVVVIDVVVVVIVTVVRIRVAELLAFSAVDVVAVGTVVACRCGCGCCFCGCVAVADSLVIASLLLVRSVVTFVLGCCQCGCYRDHVVAFSEEHHRTPR